MKSQQCAPLKHHYDECAERVMQQQEEHGKAEEDCVEECKFRDTPITLGDYRPPTAFSALHLRIY